MSFFSYKAMNGMGEIVTGTLEELDEQMAYDSIAASGLHVLKIRKSSALSDIYLKKVSKRGIKATDIIEFASNLSVMIRAGIPLMTAVMDIAETTDNRYMKERLLDMVRTIEMGSNFSLAVERHQDVFPDIFVSLVSVGEETGRLDESLNDIAVHLQRMEDLRNAIIRALIYPSFALVGTGIALLFWLLYVLPKMTGLFLAMDMELPPITRGMIFASDMSREYWYMFAVIPAVAFAAFKILSHYEYTRYYVDMMKLRLPVMKLVLTNKLLALFTEQLRILLSAGITIDRSFDIIIKVVNNAVFRRALLNIKEDIMVGSKISDSIQKHKYLFPNMVIRMVSIGESTGNMPEQLDYLSGYFLAKLDDLAEKMGKLIEPIIIIIVGSMFMIIIMGLLAPIYNLVAGAGSQ
ncbi:MAG: type II secretion system F family protein [Nitrospira sp.]|nr:type II secretion system F family protein [bacterium]MBL7048281.1 type II secretion system F family protein [Nitrospira sp.]